MGALEFIQDPQVAVALVSVAVTFLVIALSSVRQKKIALEPEVYTPFRLQEKEELSHDTRMFRFALQSPKHVLGLPVGQHVSMKFVDKADGKTVTRSYTPTSSDLNLGHVDFVIKVYRPNVEPRFPDGGKMSMHLERLKIGDTVDMRGPKGSLTYLGMGNFRIRRRDDRQVRRLGMMAGGTGITPMLQIISAVMREGGGMGRSKMEMGLIFANKSEDDILLRGMIEKLAAENPNFKFHYTLDNAPSGWGHSQGFITKEMVAEHMPAPGDDTLILMCGPPPMLKFACLPALEASPVLAVTSGIVAILISAPEIIGKSLTHDMSAGAEMLLCIPLMLAFTATYILRGVRLLIMFNPRSRQRWGSFLRESKFLPIVLAIFLALQVVVWSFVPSYGIPRVAGMMPYVMNLDMLLTVVASAYLYRELRKTNDLFNTSKEIVAVGGFSLLAVVMVLGMIAAGQYFTAFLMRMHLIVFMVVRFHTALWITGPGGKVAIGTDDTIHVVAYTSRPLSSPQRAGLGRLEVIINTPPLLEAFDSFCQRALCGESILFLREVATFRDSVYAVEADDVALFKAFNVMVNKFIKTGSSYEVNIDNRARIDVMRYNGEAIFKGLDKDSKAGIFNLAETQTSHMLADNLLAKFQATETYQRINEGLLAIASGDESMSEPPAPRASYVLRGLRLLVMYDPRRRQRWGSFLKERKFFTVLLAFFTILEVVVWSFVPANGVGRVANMMPIVGTLDMLLTLIASAILYRKMNEIKDLFNLSKEIKARSASSKVAVGTDGSKYSGITKASSVSRAQAGGQGRLEPIMNSPPLLEAFNNFCQKALCGESIMFLMEVAVFRNSVFAVEVDEDAQFREFLQIVNKFVKSDSSHEVNIDSRARNEVMRYGEEAIFKELQTDAKADVFIPAETQTSQMLADNLLAKFQATEQYQRINMGLLAIASGEEEVVQD
eukprot:g4399.t1